MFWLDFLFAFLIALVLSLLLAGAFGRRYPGSDAVWPGTFFLFLVIFLVAWAGGVWWTPGEPVSYGNYWIPFFFTGLFVAFLIAALIPSRTPRAGETMRSDAEERVEEEKEALAIGGFFWLLIVGLVIAIFIAYLF